MTFQTHDVTRDYLEVIRRAESNETLTLEVQEAQRRRVKRVPLEHDPRQVPLFVVPRTMPPGTLKAEKLQRDNGPLFTPRHESPSTLFGAPQIGHPCEDGG